jgi:hypothetical protein
MSFLRWLLTEQELAEIRGFVNIDGKRQAPETETSEKASQGLRRDLPRAPINNLSSRGYFTMANFLKLLG